MIERITGIVFFALAVSSIPQPICAATLAASPMDGTVGMPMAPRFGKKRLRRMLTIWRNTWPSTGGNTVVVDIEWYTPRPKTHGYIPDPSNVTLDNFGRSVPELVGFRRRQAAPGSRIWPITYIPKV